MLYGHGCVGCNLYDSARLTPWGNVAVSLGGVLFTALLTVAAVAALAWRGRPGWLPRWLLAEVIVICYGGDLVWQLVQAAQLPVPAREPVGWGLGYTDLNAATSFGSQATGWSHGVVAAVGFGAAALYTVAMVAAARWAWRRGNSAGGPRPGPARADRASPCWRLLLLEDCDELIQGTQNHPAGSALARLLNLTDGMLGQGTRVLVAITTNEDFRRLHPAVIRPGRCLAQIEMGPFSPAQAGSWLGRPAKFSAPVTLAELYAVRNGHNPTGSAQPLPTGGTGQYL